MATKVCCVCGLNASLEYFPKVKRSYRDPESIDPDGRRKYCHHCKQLYHNRAYRASHPERFQGLKRDLKSKYGMTPAEYDAMFAQQGGVCAICKRPETRRGGRKGNTLLRLSVDHDHNTGIIRGLLCGDCNRAIGSLGEDQDRLTAAIEYLQQSLAAMKVKQLELFKEAV